MKKIFFMLIAAAAITFASCGNKTNTGAEVDSLAADTTATLSESLQGTFNNLTGELQKTLEAKDGKGAISALAGLQTVYKNLVTSGKLEEAKKYGAAIKSFINEHADAIKSALGDNATVASLISGIQKLPTDAAVTAEEAKAAVSDDVTKLVSPALSNAMAAGDSAVSKVKGAAADAANAVTSGVEGAKDKVSEEASAAKEKAGEAVNSAKEKAGDAIDNAAGNLKKGLGL